jgi:phosphoenolpyruvate synthase/pyruvate phosphate dikinase
MVVPYRMRDAVVWLGGNPVGRDLVGGKGAELNDLAALGAPVPESFALSTAAYRGAAAAPR